VRLRYAYIITCTGFDKDADGNITAVRCTYDPQTKGGNAPDNRKIKGTIHWVNAADAVPIEVRLYDYLFSVERPMETRADGGDFTDNLNPNSLEIITKAWGEPAVANAAAGEPLQFERLGYFARDPDPGNVFNKTVGLRDTWGKIARSLS
jgi:glutaminyl-tRNA synthetase